MSDFRIDQITNQAGTAGPQIAGITTFNTSSGVLLPSGNTEYRGGRGRGVFGGGGIPAIVNTINYITIATTGNALDFGDLTVSRTNVRGTASSTRGFFAGGMAPTTSSVIDFLVFSSGGSASNFSNLYVSAGDNGTSACSNSIRGLWGGGYSQGGVPGVYSTIQYLNFSTQGNTSFFGDLIQARNAFLGNIASPTRGIWSGGYLSPSDANTNVIQYVTITTLGNALDFGDMTISRFAGAGCSNLITGLFAGGTSVLNVIDYLTISSTGNSIDFGDLTASRQLISGFSSSTRGVFGGGATPTNSNIIDYVTISTTGNALDFGDLITATQRPGTCSDAHGGLGD